MLLAVLLAVIALVPLWMFLRKFVRSDLLGLALSVHDDSFYYLLPAWHFSTYGYFTFDGFHKTYGFQPLYMLLLTGLSMILPSMEAVFRVALCVDATLHAATGVVVGLAVNAALPSVDGALRKVASLLAASVYLLGPKLYVNSVTLKENALASFLYVLLILCLLRALARARRQSVLADAGIGTLMGCLILTRLLPSSLLAVGVMLVVAAMRLSRRSMCIILVAMLVPLTIWGIYAKVSFGHILPTSYLVKSGGGFLGAVQYWWALGPLDVYRSLAKFAADMFAFLGDQDGTRLALARWGFLVSGVAALCLCAIFTSWWSRERTLVVALAVASLVGFFAIPILLHSRRAEWFYFKWYLFDIGAILAILCAVAIGFLGQIVLTRLGGTGVSLPPGVAAACIGLLAVGTVVQEVRVYQGIQPLLAWEYSPSQWSHVQARTTLWFRSHVRLMEGERVGAFNAGLVGFLLDGKVVNLDGLANDDIVNYIKRGGTVAEYMLRERIRYVIDIVPPDRWKELGITTRVIHSEEFKNPKHLNLPLYYITRLEPGMPGAK